MNPTIPELLDKLVTHGNPRQIADYLASQGIMGTRECADGCVIAEYLKAETGIEYITVEPGAGDSDANDTGLVQTSSRTSLHAYELPAALNALAVAFDEGEHPELESETNPTETQ